MNFLVTKFDQWDIWKDLHSKGVSENRKGERIFSFALSINSFAVLFFWNAVSVFPYCLNSAAFFMSAAALACSPFFS